MERGLLWLPLLAVFIGLAWAGWNEFQKLEAYQRWAADWERAKYDLYAVVGQRGSTLTWGRPTRQGPVACQSLDLGTVVAIALWGQGEPLPPTAQVPRGCRVCIHLQDQAGAGYDIPFTDGDLAQRWATFLQTQIPAGQGAADALGDLAGETAP